MKIFFSDYRSTPEEHTNKELKRYKWDPSQPNPAPNPAPNPTQKQRGIIWGVFVEQIINAAIVGGIAGLAAFSAGTDVGLKTAGIAFGMTFLVELRKYRKL